MSDHDATEPYERDASIERELRDLGPLMRLQTELEAQPPDPDFMRNLRVRLAGSSRASGRRETQPRPHIVAIAERHRVRSLGLGAMVALVAVLAVLFVRPQPVHSPTQVTAFAIPRPAASDLLRSYPLLVGQGAGGTVPAPWSPTELASGAAYPGHIGVRAGSLPHTPHSVPAYRLRGASFDAPRIAAIVRLLQVRAPVKRAVHPGGPWVYAEQTGPRSRPTRHSVAISQSTGQFVFHNLGPGLTSLQRRGFNDPRNVAIARAWLRRLGWPASSMPAVSLGPTVRFPNLVVLGWRGVHQADTAEAAVLIGAGGRVIDATVWPPVLQTEGLAPRSVRSAWTVVRAGKASIGVEPMMQFLYRNGSGILRQVDVVEVLTRSGAGAVFLVPVYRFRGPVYFRGIRGRRDWMALVPART